MCSGKYWWINSQHSFYCDVLPCSYWNTKNYIFQTPWQHLDAFRSSDSESRAWDLGARISAGTALGMLTSGEALGFLWVLSGEPSSQALILWGSGCRNSRCWSGIEEVRAVVFCSQQQRQQLSEHNLFLTGYGGIVLEPAFQERKKQWRWNVALGPIFKKLNL